MGVNVLKGIGKGRPSQAQIQETRRRMNQRPAIAKAKEAADDGVGRAKTAQQKADEAHSRATNAALDAAHSTAETAKSTADTAKSTADTAKSTADSANTNADSRYKKNGTEPAEFFHAANALGTSASVAVRHKPSDGGHKWALMQNTANEWIIMDESNGNVVAQFAPAGDVTVLRHLTANNNLTIGGTATVTGSQTVNTNLTVKGKIVPNWTDELTLPANSTYSYTHGLGTLPNRAQVWVDTSGNGVYVDVRTVTGWLLQVTADKLFVKNTTGTSAYIHVRVDH